MGFFDWIKTNWASTKYKIEGNMKDLQEIYDLFYKFKKGEKKSFDELADKEWEGNIVWALGGDTKDFYIRGFIQTCEFEEGILSIVADEVEGGTTDFRKFLENHYEGMKVYYIVEDKENERFLTNDREHKYFSYPCILHSCVDDKMDLECFDTEEQALEYFAKRLKVSSLTMEEVDEWSEKHEDDEKNYVYFNGYEIID